MARYTGPKWRLSRREGIELFSRRRNCLERRENPPGDHGTKRTKLSNYGIQLREKQKVKRIYGVLEKQFRRYYEKATRSKGVTGEVLLQMLERRLDNTVFRLGFAITRPQARQMVSHGLLSVNDKKVNIPSYQVKAGDEISAISKDGVKNLIQNNLEDNKKRSDLKIPEWLSMDEAHLKGKVQRLPLRDDVMFPINEQLIVELYSK